MSVSKSNALEKNVAIVLGAKPSSAPKTRDHRVDVAERKRLVMRARLIDATMHVFGNRTGSTPVIDDVIHEAKVSRGTFYNYFDSLDAVLIMIGQDLSNQMTEEFMPIYDILEDPLQRFSAGYRLFLMRAVLDHKWAGFVTRTDAWAENTLVNQCMSHDLRLGRQLGRFHFDDLQAATDFLKGASAYGIQALREGVSDPATYINAYVRMGLVSLGCHDRDCEEGVRFSTRYLTEWIEGKLPTGCPPWASHIDAEDVKALFHP